MRVVKQYHATPETIKKLLEKAEKAVNSSEKMVKIKLYNNAISLSYYAFFYAAQAALLSKGLFAKTHKGVIMLFDRYYIQAGEFPKGVGRWLGRAREAREEADYNL
jgi:uncharacterized protein (UPF0332 family)